MKNAPTLRSILMLTIICQQLFCTSNTNQPKCLKLPIQTSNKHSKVPLETLLNRTLETHPYIKSLEHTKDEKKSAASGVMSSLLPSATISYAASKINDYSKTKTVLGISGTQKIIDLSAAQDYKVAKSQHTLSEYQKQLGVDTVRTDVEQAFLAAWLQLQRQEMIGALKQSSVEIFEREQHKFETGLNSRNSFLKAVATHAQNMRTVEQYENEIDTAFVALEKVTNLTLRTESDQTNNGNKFASQYPALSWNPLKNIDVPGIETALQQALENRKELIINSQETTIAGQQEVAYKKEYLPTLGLYGSLHRSQDSTATDPYNSHEAGLAVSWKFFDGLYNYHSAQASHSRKLRLQENRYVTCQTIDSDVHDAHHSLLVNMRELTLKGIELSTEKDTFNLKRAEFKAGILTQPEFDNALYSWHTAQINWLQQKIYAAVARQILNAKCGFPEQVQLK